MDTYKPILSDFKAIRMPKNFKRYHDLWISFHELSFESMGEVKKAVQSNDQSHMDKATVLADLMNKKATLIDEEIKYINNSKHQSEKSSRAS